jgi:hypothetical protein
MVIVFAAGLIALAGCQPEQDGSGSDERGRTSRGSASGVVTGSLTDAAGDTTGVVDEAVTADWTTGEVRGGAGSGVATMREARAAGHPEYDRAVFDFGGDPVPRYTMAYASDRVRACGSGDVVELPGAAWLVVRFTGARAHDEQGRVTVSERSQRVDLDRLVQLELICDFEGEVSWALALTASVPYRVYELETPNRLVIDVARDGY